MADLLVKMHMKIHKEPKIKMWTLVYSFVKVATQVGITVWNLHIQACANLFKAQ